MTALAYAELQGYNDVAEALRAGGAV